jgi:hypothetical protein
LPISVNGNFCAAVEKATAKIRVTIRIGTEIENFFINLLLNCFLFKLNWKKNPEFLMPFSKPIALLVVSTSKILQKI